MSDTSKVKQPASIWEVQRLRTLLLAHNPSRWGEIHDGDHFTHLGEAINNAEDILQEMRETLLELQKIAPDNK